MARSVKHHVQFSQQNDDRASSIAATAARRPALAVCAGSLGAVLALFFLAPVVDADAGGSRFAVATENETVTRTAMGVLRSGGNAVDAAITAALTAGVASPSSSGMGGGGFALVWDGKNGKATTLDFRETAPQGVDAAAFEHRPLPPGERGKLTGVPGEIAGLVELSKRFGKKHWADVVRPAERVAAEGYLVSEHLSGMIGFMSTALKVDPVLSDLFLPGGTPRAAGARVKNPALAKTLDKVAREGARAIYAGTIPTELSASNQAVGGALTAEEIPAYRPIEREPLHVRWEGYDVYTMAPPSAGGVMLVEALSMLTKAELQPLGVHSGAYAHLLAEVARGAVADRLRYIGDPERTPVDLGKLFSATRLSARRRSITLDHTHKLLDFAQNEHGTHHIVTADADGNVVSLTTTVNRPFGSMTVNPKDGIELNDQLDDFTADSVTRLLGLPTNPNEAHANARPTSSMTPTLVVKDGAPVLALGGSGGMAIATNVLQCLLGRLVFDETPTLAVSELRFGIPTEASTISLESAAPPELKADLEHRGEIVTTQRFALHAVQMIAFEGSKKIAAADPRKHGSALVE